MPIPFILIFIAALFFPVSSADANAKRVLLLNSYHQSFSWNENIYQGIKDVFEPSKANIKLYVENMDTKRFKLDEARKQLLFTLYKDKFKDLAFDLVILSDNNAFDFVKKFGDEFVPGVPVVFCGINNFKPEMLTHHPLFTGVPEIFDAKKTIELAQTLHPGIKEVFVLNDFLPSGIAIANRIRSDLSLQQSGLRISYAGDWSMSQLLSHVQNLSTDSIIFLGTYFRDNTGRFFTPNEVGTLLSEVAQVPIYVFNNTYLGQGVMGGYLISGYYQGKTAAKLGLRILEGEAPSAVPVMASGANRYMFDHTVLARFNINGKILPEDSIIINRPVTLWGQYKGTVIIAVIVLMALSAMTTALLILNRRLKGTKEALKESELQLKTLIRTMPDLVWLKNPQGTYLFCNYQFEQFLGRKKEDILGKTDYDFLDDASADFFRKNDKEAMDQKKPIRSEEEITSPENGQHKIFETIKTPMYRGDGQLAGVLGIGRDITERKADEAEKQQLVDRLQQAEKMEALGTMAGGVAHDLNNVLGVVVGYGELLLDDTNTPAPSKRGLKNIMSAGQKATTIVQDLLTLARRGVPNISVLNFNDIVASLLKSPELENLTAFHPGVRIQTALDQNLLNTAGSSVHIGKTIFNLVSNAAEAMPNGGTITIKTANQYLDRPVQGYDDIQEGDYAVLSVSDTGDGIHPTDLKRIFEPFYTKKVMGRSGTGLGLAVVWGTVKDHNGYINVQSEEGQGSTFILYFPMTREEITQKVASLPVSEYRGNGESILVVDDVKEQRHLATTMLKKLNYNVQNVASGEEAIAYLKKHSVDLMVLDMIMDPGIDGLDTYRQALEIHPKQKAIIVSGFSESKRVMAAQSLGAGAYVRKPYIIEKLGIAVKRELVKVT